MKVVDESSERIGKIRRWIYISVAVFLAYVFVFGDYGVYHYVQLLRRKRKIVQQLRDLEQRKKQLEDSLKRLQNDRSFLEKVARERYKLGKPNERIYVIKPSKKK
ncbi:MAG: septum formation initiator family protein [Calditrichaeota bacterium]|nr:septum formation initiator family protein [Calditrichota bacterium]